MDRWFQLAVEETNHGLDAGTAWPFGATIVRAGEAVAVAAAANPDSSDWDVSQHAEMVAMRRACATLRTTDLSDCTVYATCEPCPMCVSVMIWAGIRTCYYSATRNDAAEHGFSDAHLRRFMAGEDVGVISLLPVPQRDDCASLFTRPRS